MIQTRCPSCEEPISVREAYRESRLRCPHCEQIFQLISGDDAPDEQEKKEETITWHCHSCGRRLVARRSDGDQITCDACGRAQVPPWKEEETEDSDQLLPPPWERRGTLGYGTAIMRTLKELSFSPSTFFERVRRHSPENWGPSFQWAGMFIVGSILLGFLINFVLNPLFLFPLLLILAPLQGSAGPAGMVLLFYVFFSVIGMIFSMIGAFLTLFIWICFCHLGVLLVGGSGFARTMKVYLYVAGLSIWLVIPGVGGLVTLALQVYALYWAYRKVHRMNMGQAIAAVSLPYGLLFFFSLVTFALNLFLGVWYSNVLLGM